MGTTIMLHANNCPFMAGGMLTNSRYFVGRKRELQELISSMTGAQPVSVNVHGERRIGKSSLMHHFQTSWPDRVAEPRRYAVAYLDLQGEVMDTVDRFYQVMARALSSLSEVRIRLDLNQSLKLVQNRQGFVEALEQWKALGVRPVICLDQFEKLGEYPVIFNDDFFDNLRSLLNRGLLMLVIVTRQPLGKLRRKMNLTSSFFNLGHHCPLGDLQPDEVEALVARPSLENASELACLSTDEQMAVRKWGGNHPFTLQLAAYCLYHARQGGGIERARSCFDHEVNNNPNLGVLWRWSHLPVQGTVTSGLALFGRVGERAGRFAYQVKQMVVGLAVVFVALLIILGVISLNDLIEFFAGFYHAK